MNAPFNSAIFVLLVLGAVIFQGSRAFSFVPQLQRTLLRLQQKQSPLLHVRNRGVLLQAGGFEWEDPSERFDQEIENPFKNSKLEEESSLKIDPARLLGPRLEGSNLYFIGMMGTGKSTVGNLVAKRMGRYNYLDTDEIIEQATGVTISQIFETEGEEGFRIVEAQVLNSVHSYVRCVISTGGGIVCYPANWPKLQTGIVIWLDVDPTILMKRIKGSTDRPLLQTPDPFQTLTTLLKERMPLYSQADVRIQITNDNMTENDVADLVVRQLHDYIDENPPAWRRAKIKAQATGLD